MHGFFLYFFLYFVFFIENMQISIFEENDVNSHELLLVCVNRIINNKFVSASVVMFFAEIL